MFDELKQSVWMNGREAVDDLLGYEHDVEEEKDITEARMDAALTQMPVEKIKKLYTKYCCA